MVDFLNKIGLSVIAYAASVPLWQLALQCVGLYVFLSLLSAIESLLVTRFLSRHTLALGAQMCVTSRVLIAGDGSALGIGARDAKHSLAGFLSKDFPNASIDNVAEFGADTIDVKHQLDRMHAQKYNLIVIAIGGNDVWMFSSLSHLRKELSALLLQAKLMSEHRVILVFLGNEGFAPFFSVFVRDILRQRAEEVKDLFAQVAEDAEVPFLELLSNPAENPFLKNPQAMFAHDGLHPSDAGYWEWYKLFWRLMARHGYQLKEDMLLPSESMSCVLNSDTI
jgi:lysophospholipase L1-like esterase